ncbi:MAG TPA: aromatic acid decarboxylase [Desulfobacteraceae bacterium]|nr:aromatic acid decarboxylase [Desulfobacteraceae bacterium]|tara:strand:- start:283 stop:918 length:636 start_codon:yes stop_codon:yes gene_type:complete
MNAEKLHPEVPNKGKTYVVAVTGASGSIYGVRLIKTLAETGARVLVILSDAGRKVLIHEMSMAADETLLAFLLRYGVDKGAIYRVETFSQEEIASAPASGSFVHNGMAVVPCSMKTLAAIAGGYADNLITRSCDVTLKERRPLILVPRETPFSVIHLENMTRAAGAGAVILPPCPSFYSFPKTVTDVADTVVARIMDHLGAEHRLTLRWGE